MARCKECIHYEICAKEGRLTQIDAHTWEDYNQLDDVERFCNNFIGTADVVPKSEVEKAKQEIAREIFEEIEKTARAALILLKFESDENIRNAKKEYYEDLIGYIAELKKKYTESEDKG